MALLLCIIPILIILHIHWTMKYPCYANPLISRTYDYYAYSSICSHYYLL